MDRLDFQLPEFTRLAWVSDHAREIWEPRIRRISAAWVELTWKSVALGLRPCALVDLPSANVSRASHRWSEHGLSWYRLEPMASRARTAATDRRFVRVVVGSAANIERLKECRDMSDHDGIGKLLGFPPCCRKFFRQVWVDRRLTDTTWPMARGTRPDAADNVIEVDGAAPANILNRWLGVRAVHHLPCRFDCQRSTALGRRYLDALREIGRTREAAWIEQILSWPVEWSALHGIAEVRNPVVKIVTQTDATPGKHVVRWKGTAYPAEGAIGLHFPFRTLQDGKPGDATGADIRRPGWQRKSDWYYADNDFSELVRMTDAHRPIVALARRELARRSGAVMDLGCGNGALLQAICHRRPRLVPHGIDAKATALDHAGLLLPQHAANFAKGDIFSAVREFKGRRFALVILMAGRLVEVPRKTADEMLSALTASSDRILLYVYPGWYMTLQEIADRLDLELEPSTGGVALLATQSHERSVSPSIGEAIGR